MGKDKLGKKFFMKTCAIIPAFNEAKSISNVIKEIKAIGIDVVVIDDGSSDDTSAIAANENAHVIRHNKRLGKGLSLKDGLAYVAGKDYDMVVTMDADGQHEPSAILKFIDKAKQTNASAVIGNRMDNPTDMPLIRILTNRFMSSVLSLICKQYIPDTQCGYRLYSENAIKSIDIKTRKFEIESEIIIKLARKGYKIESMPIRSIYAGESSKIRPVRDTFRFLFFITKILLSGN
ncbi:MAG: glycosyltransferase family 2 protein [Candidatus Omnitrophota bacterium]